MILTEVHLESHVCDRIGSFAKAKEYLGDLNVSRTAADSIYGRLRIQVQLDLQSGVLHIKDSNYTIKYLYFFETFGNLSEQGNAKGELEALKYILLCKVIFETTEDETIGRGRYIHIGRNVLCIPSGIQSFAFSFFCFFQCCRQFSCSYSGLTHHIRQQPRG